MTKTIKKFNGRGGYRRDAKGNWTSVSQAYVGATSKAEAVALMHRAGFESFTMHELNEYWSKGAWGTKMDATVSPPQRGVWVILVGEAWHTDAVITRLL